MTAKITVKDNGSLKVEGDFELYDTAGNKYDLAGRQRISLCRCGASATKPFCDHSHRDIGFSSVCTAYALEPLKPPPV
jgi:CDGSH-type Zn-finger protein